MDYIIAYTGLFCCLNIGPEAETLPLVDGSSRVGVKAYTKETAYLSIVTEKHSIKGLC